MPYSDFTKQDYSDQDFLRLIQQRVRKEIRQNHLLDPKKTYSLDTSSMAGKVLQHFLHQIFEDRLQLGDGILISTEYLEKLVAKKLNIFLEAKNPEDLKSSPIAPLRSVTEHELVEVAKLLNIQGDFSPVQHEVVDQLAKKYPQTKPSFVKSFLHIEHMDK